MMLTDKETQGAFTRFQSLCAWKGIEKTDKNMEDGKHQGSMTETTQTQSFHSAPFIAKDILICNQPWSHNGTL